MPIRRPRRPLTAETVKAIQDALTQFFADALKIVKMVQQRRGKARTRTKG